MLFVADMLERAVLDEGFRCLGPAPDTTMAAAEMAEVDPDAAILDFDLDGETAEGLADELDRRGVPILFITGYPISEFPERFRSRCLEKPFSTGELRSRVRGLVRGN